MNIDQMKYIIQVTKEGSITKAAEKLHLSPAAISQSISLLENELGFPIFTRSKRGMSPTSEGQLIISKSYEILTKIQELYEELAIQKKEVATILRVACTPSMTNIIYDAFLSFMKTNKEANVIIEELDQDSILLKVKNGDIHIAFAPFSKEELDASAYKYGIRYDHIYKGYVCVCVYRNTHLASFTSITPEDLKNEKSVMYNSNYVKSFHEKHLAKKEVFVTSNNTEVLISAILQGHAYTLVYNFFLKNHTHVKNGNLVMVPFKNPDVIYEDFWSIHSLSAGLSSLAKHFEREVIQFLDV